MPNPLNLYSCQSWLAFAINQRFYKDFHYVWCTPYFDPKSPYAPAAPVPPTSSPRELYNIAFEEVERGDRHSPRVSQNRLGVIRGADIKLGQNVITQAERDDIVDIVADAEMKDFRPVLYVIPHHLVYPRLQPAAIKSLAHPLSLEFIIADLKRDEFDVWELR